MLFGNLSAATILSRIVILIIAFTFHEFGHAFVADRFGDDTPRRAGRLTLNPIVHLDLMGSLMLLFSRFGWAKPVPINPYALRRSSPSAMMWVSLTGPLANLLLAITAAIPFRLGLVPYSEATNSMFPTLFAFLFEFILINLSLMLFNLIPISPLDGKEILDYFLPETWSRRLDGIQPYGPIILLVLVFVGPMVGLNIFSWIMTPALTAIMKLLVGGVF
ncbi:MAG: site-2 protease family protein [Anaerolineaceae bacterium]